MTLIINPRFLTDDKAPEAETANGAAWRYTERTLPLSKKSISGCDIESQTGSHTRQGQKDMSVSVRQELNGYWEFQHETT